MNERSVPVSMGSPHFVTHDGGSFLCTHAWFPPNASLEPHIHDRPTFAIMLEGAFELRFTSPAIERRERSCPSGTIFTEPAGERHGNRVGSGGAHVVVVQPDPDADGRFDPFRELLLDSVNHFCHGGILLGARRLAREVRSPDRLSPLAIEALVFELMVMASRFDARVAAPGARARWFIRAEEFVRAHFRDRIRIADIAEAAGIHPRHLAVTFREVHGIPLGSYIRRLRVEWAADRLIDTCEQIGAIAFQAGFADQPHFTRVFKRHIGCTPGRYRRSLRDGGSGTRPN